jgi:hypothetical protein
MSNSWEADLDRKMDKEAKLETLLESAIKEFREFCKLVLPPFQRGESAIHEYALRLESMLLDHNGYLQCVCCKQVEFEDSGQWVEELGDDGFICNDCHGDYEAILNAHGVEGE